MKSIGSRIRIARKNMGFTQGELGKKLKVSATQISKWEDPQGNPRVNTLKKVAKALAVPIENFLDHQNEQDCTIQEEVLEYGKKALVPFPKASPLTTIPLFNASLGLGWRTPPIQEMTDMAPVVVHKSVLKGKKGPFIAARVEGDSMLPILESGDIVVIATGEKKICPGKIYAVRLEGELAVKKVDQLDKTTLVYSSFSPNAPLIKVNTKIEKNPIIGMIIGGWKSFNDVRW
jgi:transcriptional regulator with XRE-family HTH domain